MPRGLLDVVGAHAEVTICDCAAEQINTPPLELVYPWLEGAQKVREMKLSIAEGEVCACASGTQEGAVRVSQVEVVEPWL